MYFGFGRAGRSQNGFILLLAFFEDHPVSVGSIDFLVMAFPGLIISALAYKGLSILHC